MVGQCILRQTHFRSVHSIGQTGEFLSCITTGSTGLDSCSIVTRYTKPQFHAGVFDSTCIFKHIFHFVAHGQTLPSSHLVKRMPPPRTCIGTAFYIGIVVVALHQAVGNCGFALLSGQVRVDKPKAHCCTQAQRIGQPHPLLRITCKNQVVVGTASLLPCQVLRQCVGSLGEFLEDIYINRPLRVINILSLAQSGLRIRNIAKHIGHFDSVLCSHDTYHLQDIRLVGIICGSLLGNLHVFQRRIIWCPKTSHYIIIHISVTVGDKSRCRI